jgi:hypothetical protein
VWYRAGTAPDGLASLAVEVEMATIEKTRTGGGALVVQERAGGPVFCAKWRDPGPADRSSARSGPAWVIRDGDPQAKPNGERFGGWVERRGRETSVPTGTLTWRAALRRLDEVRLRRSSALPERRAGPAPRQAARAGAGA